MTTFARSRSGILLTAAFLCGVAGHGVGVFAGCIDADADGWCAGVDCDDDNRFCGGFGCTDQDGDGICAVFDCDDTVARCDEGSFWDDCSDNDRDGVPDCADCAVANPYCRKDCADNPDGDAYCGASDPCPLDPQNVDTDGDGFCTAQDNCPSVANPSQADHEGELLGQWAFSANASSEWSSTDYSAMQATGTPESAGVCADVTTSWSPLGGLNDPEVLELRYATPVHALGADLVLGRRRARTHASAELGRDRRRAADRSDRIG